VAFSGGSGEEALPGPFRMSTESCSFWLWDGVPQFLAAALSFWKLPVL